MTPWGWTRTESTLIILYRAAQLLVLVASDVIVPALLLVHGLLGKMELINLIVIDADAAAVVHLLDDCKFSSFIVHFLAMASLPMSVAGGLSQRRR